MNLRILLAPLSLIYNYIITLRNHLYNIGLKKSENSGIKVVSIGNITAGGSGKSPMAIETVSELLRLDENVSVAIVSRGYGRKSKGVQVVSDGKNILLDASQGGDEPLMIAKSLSKVPVVVSEKRVDGVKRAISAFSATIVVLDDAFQHRKIERDLDIVLIDASAPSWYWKPLPMGMLRDIPQSLERADMIILTGKATAEKMEKLKTWISKYSSAKVLHGGMIPSRIINHSDNSIIRLEDLSGKRVAACAGIVRPDRFFETLEAIGIDVVHKSRLRDHAFLTKNDIDNIVKSALEKGVNTLIITAKDAVKWPYKTDSKMTILVLEMGWRWYDGHDYFRDSLAGILEAC
jgi:tetraacyldisaccharide 4'-kinase